MSAYAITSDLASVTKLSIDTITMKPHNQYIGTQLNDNRMQKLYATYCGLLLEQYAEDLEQLKEQKNDD